MDAKSAIQIGLAIAVLGSLFLAYLSSKNWQIGHVVLVVCIFLSTIFFWYLAAATMKVHATHRSQIARLEQQIRDYQQQNAALQTGTDDAALRTRLESDGVRIHRGSIRQAQHELRKMLLDRGRMWVDVQPQAVGGDGTTQLAVAQPQPHGIPAGAIVFAFEQGSPAEGARYLGEFSVTASAEGAVTIKPSVQLSTTQLGRLSRTNNPWTLYEIMPIDRHDVFLSLSENELSELLPADSLPEYQKDGEPAAEDDPAERVIGYKKDGTRATAEEADEVVEQRYTRQLRDYAYFFRRQHAQAVVDADTREQLKRDAVMLQDAIAKAEQGVAYRTAEKQKLEYDKEKFEQELQVITAHLQTIERYLSAVEARLRDTVDKTRATAAQLAQEQLKAAEEINRRTVPVPDQGATMLQTALQ